MTERDGLHDARKNVEFGSSPTIRLCLVICMIQELPLAQEWAGFERQLWELFEFSQEAMVTSAQ